MLYSEALSLTLLSCPRLHPAWLLLVITSEIPDGNMMGPGPASPLLIQVPPTHLVTEPQPLTLLVSHLLAQQSHLWVTNLGPGWQSKRPGA